MNVSEKLVQLRKSTGMSQEELAEKLEVSRQAVSRWERGTALPDAAHILALSRLYSVTTDYLLNDDGVRDEDLPKVKTDKTILHKNLTLLAIIVQASFLNAAAQPWVGGDINISIVMALKLMPLLLASIWMASNHRYEIDQAKRSKNTKIEMCYCMCQAGIAVTGYTNHWTWITAFLLLTVALCYIFVVNPNYMDRVLVQRKRFVKIQQP
ncbi:MAG: helix-turn-helix transcriptional regulator [Solobacterium sp.]|nr:helix-turn-helix transcriptional regulator [Solobacterium sp.]